jgi:hypothetical protein
MKKVKFKFDWPYAPKNPNRDLFVILKNRYSVNRMRKSISNTDRPNVSKVLWWDWDYERMNFRKAHITVISRIVEYGTVSEWAEMIRFYGRELIIHDLKFEI